MKKSITFLFFLLIGSAFLSAQTINGIVKDADTNEGLIGASIQIENTSQGTVTDLDGNFSLETNQALPLVLVVSYTGYNETKINVTDISQSLEVAMVQGLTIGGDIVVSASRRKEKITKAPSSINVISAKAISEVVTQNALELIGREKGVDFVQKGVNEVDVNIRGFNTAFNTSTLYLTDGKLNTFIAANIPYGIIDPVVKEDISQIEVVLGPSSSLYGANAFSGLVNITTKNPMNDQGTDIALSAGNQSVLSGRFSSRHKVSDNFGCL